jgi:hypothetical protein
MRTVATGKIKNVKIFTFSAGLPERCTDTIFRRNQIHQLCLAFNANIERSQSLDQHLFVKILRINQWRRIPAQSYTQLIKPDLPNATSPEPETARTCFDALLSGKLVDAHLTIKFQIANVED